MKLLVYVIGLFIGTECKLTEIIRTTKGPVQGEILRTVLNSIEYSAFKGIPYAEPPVGYLRFKPPIEKTAWLNVLQTAVEGANCIQKDFVYNNFTGSENCLYLNVYTPQNNFSRTNDESKPVMVWIHGGTFKSGYGNSSLYGPDFIVEEGVVLVTFNYRLGPLGFLSLNHDNATGNAGLKDQNLVLHWVNQNIAEFGGNPKQITLFGQSAGGVAVDLHALSDMSRGLFHQSISMSASPLCPWSFCTSDNAEKQAFILGSKLNVHTNSKEDILNALYNAPAVLLMKITEELGSTNPAFAPTIERTDVAQDEEKFLTECSYNKYMNGNFIDIPHITGFTNHETLLFTKSMESISDLLNATAHYVESIPAISPVTIPFIDTILSIIADSATSISKSLIMQLVQETSDLLFVQGIDSKQKIIQEKNSHPVYYYHLKYVTEQCIHKLLYNISLDGVAHGDDFGYLFHMKVVNLSLDPNDPTFITRKKIVRLWTNFAKYGNPTPGVEKDDLLDGVIWPESGPTGIHLAIDKNLSVGQRPTNAKVQFYQLANDVTLPLQMGCTTNYVDAITNFIKKPMASFFNNWLG